MSDVIEIILLEDRERWISAHRDFGLPSQSWHYAWGLSASGILPRLALVRCGGQKMLLPFHERRWRDTTDVASIVGLSGASFTGRSAAPLRLWREFAQTSGWVAGYIQLAPLGGFDAKGFANELTIANEVCVLQLEGYDAAKSASQTVRAKIRHGSESGVLLIEDRAAIAASLKLLYPLAMERVGAAPAARFTAETLERWVFDASSVVLGAGMDDSIEAVCIFLTAGIQAEYHIMATSARFRDLSAWLIWKAMQRLSEMGMAFLNLGGGVRPGDGLYAFKRRFGATPRPLWALHQIYDSKKYLELCSATPARITDWFPAYRARES